MNHFQCEICGKKDALVFQCNYCHKYFCAEHHLPENHDCTNKPRITPYYVRPPETKTNEPLPKIGKPIPYRSTYSHPKHHSKITWKKITAISITALIIGSLFWLIIQNNSFVNTQNGDTTTSEFTSALRLIDYLKNDNLSDTEWTTNHTCTEFANDFIKRAEASGHYCFTYYALLGDELDNFIDAVESITVTRNRVEIVPTEDPLTKQLIRTQEYYHYNITTHEPLKHSPVHHYIQSTVIEEELNGHAVVKTSINGTELIVDPQTDIILRKESRYNEMALVTEEYFIAHYKGEIENIK
jgi:hypothetical protein